MSQLIVEVCEVNDVLPHPNADRLEILIIKGWRVVAQKNFLKKGDKCVYFPPDSVMTPELAERLNITKYLSQLPVNSDGTRDSGLRVKAACLRGESSFGTIMECENPDWEIGTDVKDFYNIRKFEPVEKQIGADAEVDDPAFHKYTSIENIRNFPNVIKDGEEVAILEKINGCLHKYTKITLACGETKKMCQVEIGEKIRSYDEFKCEYVEDEVVGIVVREPSENLCWYELKFDNGENLICTEDHRILTKNRGWVQAKDLNEYDLIL